VAAAIVGRCAVLVRHVHFSNLLDEYTELRQVFSYVDPPPHLDVLSVVAGGCALFFLVASFAGLARRRWAIRLVRKAYIVGYALLFFYGYMLFALTGQVEDMASPSTFKLVGSTVVDAVAVFFWRYDYLWPATCGVILFGILHLNSWRRRVMNVYSGSDDTSPAIGDRVVENMRSLGKDRKYRKSTLSSVWTHLLIIVIIPWLLRLYGCIDPYRAPYGGGKTAVMLLVKRYKPKKKPRKKYVLNMDSAIIFHIPDLDESKIYEEVEEMTQLRYTADATAAYGKLGDGDAAQAGWQDGFKDGVVRFIRIKHSGRGWDDGMDSRSRADLKFLEKFRELSGGQKDADDTEHNAIRLLKRYPKDQSPPFVYITGQGHFNIPERDVKALRKFLLNGSMLFADCGSREFDGSFRHFATRLFPGAPLRPIADDDPIFQLPFAFPHGAPPLWHHGGTRAMGVKHGGRWIVFYHPGDLNDAWKTGHSGLDGDMAQGAFHMGINIVYYSFMRYFEATKKHR